MTGSTMGKQEFIERLRTSLSGRVSASLVEENISYYEEYINTRIRMGEREEAVLANLGDPRLIAKSIINANYGHFTEEETITDKKPYDGGYYAQKRSSNLPKIVNMPGWMILIILLVIIIVIIGIIGSIVSALIPIVAPVLLVVFLVKLFRDWLN